jgi:hypothetical protein
VIRKTLIAAGLLASAQALPALASDVVPVPVRPQGFVFVAPDGPSVLDTDFLGDPVAPASRPDLVQPAVPVVEVMNGGGFGYSGFDYYNDQISEGRFGARRRPKEYVIAPAYVVPPRP